MAKAVEVVDLFLGIDDGPGGEEHPSMDGDHYAVLAKSPKNTFKVIGWTWNTEARQLVLDLQAITPKSGPDAT